ncbi:MAG: SGNH/GDSL hydrolase family protein [Balneola sp.]|nr:MAG: SGNH/GDSL hydrolase family protein [Balneola sp.]
MSKEKLSDEEKGILEQFIIPFYHIEKKLQLFPGNKSKEAEAALLGISLDELETYRCNLEENAKQAALELLKEEEVIDLIDKLPFDGEETIVAFGDSITEDDQSWFSILRNLLEISFEKPAFNFINSGVSYNTTSEALRRMDRDVLIHNPDWVFVALGTFDVQRLNIASDRTLIPLSETWENLNTISLILDDQVENPTLWMTPSPVISELLDSNPLYEFSIEAQDLEQVRQLVSGKTGGIVDPKGLRMGEGEPKAWNYLSDGLHHSLSGHVNTVREVLRTLAEVKIKS